MATRIQIRRDYDYKWLQVNPILAEGEVGFVINTNRIKIGNGKDHWNDLDYIAADSAEAVDILKQMEDYTYNKDTIEKKFIDPMELEQALTIKESEILKNVNQNHYTKDETDATFVKDYELKNVEDYLTVKIEKLEENKANINDVYTKQAIDNKLASKQDTIATKNMGENVYLTYDEDGNSVINVSLAKAPGKDIEFVDTDTIEFEQISETDKLKKVKASVKNADTIVHKDDLNNYYTKDEVFYSVQTVSNKLDESIAKTNADIEKLDTLKANKVDLAPYALTKDVNKALELKADKISVYTKAETDDLLSKVATKDEVNAVDNKFDEYWTKYETDYALSLKADKTELNQYATKAELDEVITGGEIDLTNYYTKSEVDEIVDKIDVSEQLKDYATIDYVNSEVQSLEQALDSKADKDDLVNYATKDDLNNIPQVSFENSDTVEFSENDGKTSAKVINVYTKAETDDLLSNAVKYQAFNYNGIERKTIQLNNYDSISGIDTTGNGHNLVMLSKWDVADFGAPGVHMNLNTKDTVTINDKDVVATEDYVQNEIGKISVYTKSEIDDKLSSVATKEELNTVSISTRAEIEEITKRVDGITESQNFIQISDDSVVNLKDGCMLIYDEENKEWKAQPFGVIRTIN